MPLEGNNSSRALLQTFPSEEGEMDKRIRSKHPEYLRYEARRLREEADALPSGQARNELLQKATRRSCSQIEKAGISTGRQYSFSERES
jgi:hypothetical protein